MGALVRFPLVNSWIRATTNIRSFPQITIKIFLSTGDRLIGYTFGGCVTCRDSILIFCDSLVAFRHFVWATLQEYVTVQCFWGSDSLVCPVRCDALLLDRLHVASTPPSVGPATRDAAGDVPPFCS